MLWKRGVQVEWCEEIDTTGQSATIKESKEQATRSGYCSRWSWAQASSHQHGRGRSINVYNASNQNIISVGVLPGPAPLSLYWEIGGTSFTGILGSRGRLGILWRPSSLALRGWFTGRRVLLNLGFRRPPPLPLLTSHWGSFGCRPRRASSVLLVFAALGTTAPSFHG